MRASVEVSRLQRRVRLLEVMVIASLSVTVLAVSGDPVDTAREVRAQKFVLVDAGGQALGELGVAEEDRSVRLVIRREGQAGAWLGVRADGAPGLALLRPSGLPRVEVRGGEAESTLRFYGEAADRPHVHLLYSEKHGASLELSDPSGRRRVDAEARDDEAGIWAFDPAGQPRAAAIVPASGEAKFVIWSAAGQPRAVSD